MKAKIIYLECGTFSGIMRVLIGDNVWPFELGTPNYNDYGEYRLELSGKPITLESYKERFKDSPMIDHEICELTQEDMEFWNRLEKQMSNEEDESLLTAEDSNAIEVSEDGCGHVTSGRGKDEKFYVYHNYKWTIYEDFKTSESSNPYNKVMYSASEVFFQWYNKLLSFDYLVPSNDVSLNIYPE